VNFCFFTQFFYFCIVYPWFHDVFPIFWPQLNSLQRRRNSVRRVRCVLRRAEADDRLVLVAVPGPQARWLIYFMEVLLKWMIKIDKMGCPNFRKAPITRDLFDFKHCRCWIVMATWLYHTVSCLWCIMLVVTIDSWHQYIYIQSRRSYCSLSLSFLWRSKPM
jgi:hypothetical protein